VAANARALFAAHGVNGVGYFADGDDKDRWVDPAGRGVVAFRLIGAHALVVGDPLAAPDDLPAVLGSFLAHCRRQGWTPAFYQTLGTTAPLYRGHGLRALAIGVAGWDSLAGVTALLSWRPPPTVPANAVQPSNSE